MLPTTRPSIRKSKLYGIGIQPPTSGTKSITRRRIAPTWERSCAIANLYRVTPLAAGEAPAGPPVAYVRQKRLAIKEDIRFYADEGETQELFRIAARSVLDIGGSRYDVLAGGERIGYLWHKLRESLVRTTWHVGGPNEEEVAIARER